MTLSHFCFHPLPPLLCPATTTPSPCSPPSESNWGKASSCLFLSSLPGSNLSHEWLLQCGHGTSCHMGDLISVCLKHNQLPPKTSQEHDDYCFPLILVLINKVAAHCEGPLLSILVQTTQKREKMGKELQTILPKCSVSEEMIWLLPDCLVGWVLSLEQMCDYKCRSFITGKWLTVSNTCSRLMLCVTVQSMQWFSIKWSISLQLNVFCNLRILLNEKSL